MVCDLAPCMELIETGRVRAIAVSTAARIDALPTVPPLAETIPGFDESGWQMVVAPAATPGPVVERLHAAVKSILEVPEVRSELVRLGMTPFHTPALADLKAHVKQEGARWAKIVQQAGIAGSQ